MDGAATRVHKSLLAAEPLPLATYLAVRSWWRWTMYWRGGGGVGAAGGTSPPGGLLGPEFCRRWRRHYVGVCSAVQVTRSAFPLCPTLSLFVKVLEALLNWADAKLKAQLFLHR